MKNLFARRRYLHFDEPLAPKDAKALAMSPVRVASWAFMPMLHWIIQAHKVKRQDDGSLEKRAPKDRPISYAAHKDAGIYAYYGQLLGARYEAYVREVEISDCVTAFREDCKRCNIDFAQESFEWIRQKGECAALAFDIKGFFDNLDHVVLKAMWCKILKEPRLPEDHFAVFRSLTRYAFVDRAAVFKEFGISLQNPRANRRKRICSPAEFRERVRGKHLIQTHKATKGIPQGSPMSATLSNIYMLEFDIAVFLKVKSVGGFYRRYCDDMLCIVPSEHEKAIEEFVMEEIEKIKLEIQAEKTKRHHFRSEAEKLSVDEPLQYLGFIFDGSRALLRTASVAQ